GAGLVHEVDLHAVVRDGFHQNLRNCGWFTRACPSAETFREQRAHLRFGDVSHHDELRALRHERVRVEGAYARRVERGGRRGITVSRVVVRMARGKDDLI